jgi:hypothetical protein
MNPSANSSGQDTNDPAANVPAYDPSQVSIVSAAEPRYGIEPEPSQFSEPQPQPVPQAQAPPPPPMPVAPPQIIQQLPPQPMTPPPPAQIIQPATPAPPIPSPDPIPPPPPTTVGGGAPATTSPPKETSTASLKLKTNPNSTQNTLQIAEIRDGIVIMNDGSFRSVVMVKSINFDLMSPQEQEAVEYSYQGFLNSLYFQIQIFIRSRKVDLRPYVERLDKIRSEHDNMLLALLMEDYIEYMTALSQQTNIMDKNFYVIIPFFPVVEVQKALTQNKKFLSGVTKLFDRSEQHVTINEADLENAKTELRNRVQAVLSGLQQCGIQGLPLDTQELIELYYDSYNPDTATRQQLKDFRNLTADVVTKGVGTAPQPHLQRELK